MDAGEAIQSSSRADVNSNPVSRGWWSGPVWMASLLLVLFLAIPLIALILRTVQHAGGIVDDETLALLREAARLTVVTSVCATAVTILLGTPLAYLLARRTFRGRRLVETLVDLPMVLPPAVAGLALLMAFGRRGLVGQPLDDLGITIGFTAAAVVLAQIFVSTPFYVRSARAGFVRAARQMEESAADLGAAPPRVFWTITVPLARPAIAAGIVLAWARAIGEFGATILFAGSLPGRTRTMTLTIYGRYEAGDLETALLLSVILLIAAFLVIFAARLIGSRASSPSW